MNKLNITVESFVKVYFNQGKLENIELDHFTGQELVEIIQKYNKLIWFIDRNYDDTRIFKLSDWIKFIDDWFEWQDRRETYQDDFVAAMHEPNPPHYVIANND